MKQQVDIDTILERTKLSIKINGKEYVISDIPMDKFLSLLNPNVDDQDVLLIQLSELLNVGKEELSDLGIRAISLAIKAIREWILGDGEETGNP